MGVYIKDLKKPENCDICPIFLVFTTCGLDRDHCMFQDVPEPHGRLIDADKLMKRMWDETDCMISVPATFVRDAPTVIPASEEGE